MCKTIVEEAEPEWPIWVDSFIQPRRQMGLTLWAIDGSGSMNDEYPKVLQGSQTCWLIFLGYHGGL